MPELLLYRGGLESSDYYFVTEEFNVFLARLQLQLRLRLMEP